MLALPDDRRGRAWGADEARYAAMATFVVSVSALAGCASAPTVGDGSLGVGWAVLPTPVVPTPQVGVCTARDGVDAVPRVSWDMSVFSAVPQKSVDCTAEHLAETYFVGTFPADAETDAAGRPKLGTALFRSAYETCAERATEFPGRRLPHRSAGDRCRSCRPTGSGRARPAGTGAS